MKKTLLIAFCASLSLWSCKKSDVPKNSEELKNSISLTVDGITKKYTVASTAIIGPYLYQGSALFVASYASDSNVAESVQLKMTTGTDITFGTYKNDGKTGLVSITYCPNDYTAANQDYYTSDSTGGLLSTITITSITDKNVQGTFSGQLVKQDKTVKTVSNGKFNVNITDTINPFFPKVI